MKRLLTSVLHDIVEVLGFHWTKVSGYFPKKSQLFVLAASLLPVLGFFTGCHSIDIKPVPHFPVPHAKNYHGLVSVHWLKDLLDYHDSGLKGFPPMTCHNEKVMILEAGWGSLEEAKDYHNGHIPGAIHVNTDDFENGSPRWRLRSVEDLHAAIGRAGISNDTTVIVYGTRLIAAARIWWILKYAGVADVRLLDGGVHAWKKAGYMVEKKINSPQPAEFSGKIDTKLLATTDYVREHLFDETVCLADVRSAKEFNGQISGYNYIEAKGRIPSSIHFGDGGDEAYLYKQRNGHFKPSSEILELWRRHGILPVKEEGKFEKEVIFYCGGGWRSSVPFFYAWLLGFDNIRNYSDGWSGWSTEYIQDPEEKGSTPGWRQQLTGNPIER